MHMEKTAQKIVALLLFLLCLGLPPAARAEEGSAGLAAGFMEMFAPEDQSYVARFLGEQAREWLKLYQPVPDDMEAISALAELAERAPDHPLLRYLRLLPVTDRANREFAVLMRPLFLPRERQAVEEALFIYDHLDSPPAEYEDALEKTSLPRLDGLFERERYQAGKSPAGQWAVFLCHGLWPAGIAFDRYAAAAMTENGKTSLHLLNDDNDTFVYINWTRPVARVAKTADGNLRLDVELTPKLSETYAHVVPGVAPYDSPEYDDEYENQWEYIPKEYCYGDFKYIVTWNPQERQFDLRREKTSNPFSDCRPIENETDIVPVELYYSEILPSSAALQAYDVALNQAWKEFYGLFAPDSKKIVLRWYRDYRKEQQKNLLPYVGNPRAFAVAQAHDTLLISFMRAVIEEAREPGGRLQLLLSVIASRGEDDSASGALYVRNRVEPDREAAVKRCAEADHEADDEPGDYLYYGNGSILCIEWTNLAHYGSLTTMYMMEDAGNATFYGQKRVPDALGGEDLGSSLTRVQNGLISFLYFSSLPKDDDFFKDREEGWPGMPEEKDDGDWYACRMYQSFEFTADRKSLSVRLVPREDWQYPYTPCIAQCYIPYVLEKNKYARKPPVCLPDGEWGYRPPDE